MPTPKKTAGSRSGNPAKRAEAISRPEAPTSVRSWKRATEREIIELPSGNAVEIERVPLTSLLSEGLLADALGPVVQDAINKGKGMDTDQIRQMGEDPEKILAVMDTFDRVAVRCFVDPGLVFFKGDDGVIVPHVDRDPSALYSDEVALEDKIFLFQLISGGSADLATFREQYRQLMAGVADQPGLPLPSV